MTQSQNNFSEGQYVVYPAHGVGVIKGIENTEVAGFKLEMYVVNFEKQRLVLRVPVSKTPAVGMRKVATVSEMEKAFDILKGKARVKRVMWSRRAQEYEAKINSGDLTAVSEVVRDLFRTSSQPEPSFSERQIFETARDRLTREVAIVFEESEDASLNRVCEILENSVKSGTRSRAQSQPQPANESDAAAA